MKAVVSSIICVLVIGFTPISNAFDSDPFDRPERSPARDVVTISEMIPQFQGMTCEARCSDDGLNEYVCTKQFRTYKACIDDGEANGCVWSCE